MTDRILSETLPALYERHGITPYQGDYAFHLDGDDVYFACGLAIAFYEATGGDQAPDCDRVRAALGLSVSYHDGYGRGFDGNEYDAWDSDYDLGYADGAAGWAAVKDMAVTR